MLSRVETPALYGAGLALPLLTALLFRLALYFGTAFQNRALASLAWTVAALTAMAAALLLGMTTARAADRVVRAWPRFGRRSVAIPLIVLGWVALALPGLLAGPDRAHSGLFGFVGLVRKDTIDWRPVAVFALLVVVLFLGLELLARRSAVVRWLVGGVALLVLGSGTIAAGSAHVRPVVLGETVFARVALRALQHAGDRDRDGYSRWLGGGDCDDRNKQRHPGAREVAGNRQDEDCDGEDLSKQSPSAEPSAQPPARPNLPQDLSVLLITVDALRWDAMGYAGYSRNLTPNIDRLARTSVVYEQAYAISTYTGYSVPPLWASRYPSEMPRTDRHEVRFERENVLLAERLAESGFRNLGVAGHFLFAPAFHWTDGFERFDWEIAEGTAPPGSHIDLYHTSSGTADRLIRFLSEVQSQRFFLYAHFTDPHKEYLEHPGFSNFGKRNRDLYDGEVAYTDHHIGRVLRALQEGPAKDRTVVIVSADHGEAFGEHGRMFHGFEIWEEIVRVPLVISVPGLAPRHVTRPVGQVDIAPTILDLGGLARDEGARGVSLLPELAGGTLPDRPILIDQPRNPYYDTKRAFIVRSKEGTFKLHHLVDANTYRLYDLDHDPAEKHDLTGGQTELYQRMRRFYAAYVATIPDAKVIPVGGQQGQTQPAVQPAAQSAAAQPAAAPSRP
jgi:arylsulfatase A-like enzyme